MDVSVLFTKRNSSGIKKINSDRVFFKKKNAHISDRGVGLLMA